MDMLDKDQMTLQEYYEQKHKDPTLTLLSQHRCWLNELIYYDSLSGKALSADMDTFIADIHKVNETALSSTKDYLYPIVHRSEKAFQAIIRDLREKILREYKLLPIYQIRQIDSKTIQWISKKPGRTIKEKLAGKPHIMGLKRRLSVDTLENRLLKEFVKRIKILLSTKLEFMESSAMNDSDEEVAFLGNINSWLYSDDSDEIGRWQATAPTNILLHDKHYRKIWESYLNLQKLPELIEIDQAKAGIILLRRLFWYISAEVARIPNIVTAQCPISIDYEKFFIKPELPMIFLYNNTKIKISIPRNSIIIELPQKIYISLTNNSSILIEQENVKNREFTIDTSESYIEEICTHIKKCITKNNNNNVTKTNEKHPVISSENFYINLNSVRPCYLLNNQITKFPTRLWVQFWENKTDTYIVSGATSKALLLNDKNNSVGNHTLYSLLFLGENSRNAEIAYSLIQQMRDSIDTKTLHYFLPEHIPEFSLKYIKSALRANFPTCKPLPASISAIMHIQYNKHKINIKNEEYIIVLDFPCNGISITPIKAKYDEELKIAMPETNGIVWVRHPSIFVKIEEGMDPTFNSLKRFNNEQKKEVMSLLGTQGLITEKGLHLIDKDQWHPIECSTKDNKKEFLNYLSELIKKYIPEHMSKHIYAYFAIHEDLHNLSLDNLQKLDVSDVLKGGKILSQKESELTKLNNTLSLWEDDLPDLIMEVKSIDISLVKDIHIKPVFGKPVFIDVLYECTLEANKHSYNFPLRIGSEDSDTAYEAFLNTPDFPLLQDEKYDLKLSYTYGDDIPYKLIFIPHNKNLHPIEVEWKPFDPSNIDYDEFPAPEYAPVLSENFKKFPSERSWEGKKQISKSNLYDKFLTPFRDRSIKGNLFSSFYLFREGRKITNLDIQYQQKLQDYINLLQEEFQRNRSDNNILIILSNLHSEAPKAVYEMLLFRSTKINENSKNLRWNLTPISYALGALDQDWQKKIANNLINKLTQENAKKEYDIIRIIAVALWREEKIVFKLFESDIKKIDSVLNSIIYILEQQKHTKGEGAKLASICEILLAILRLRRSNNINIKKLLAPNSPKMKKIIILVSAIDNQDIGNSFVHLSLDKPEEFKQVPNLLYALQLYLKGEDTSGITIEIKEG